MSNFALGNANYVVPPLSTVQIYLLAQSIRRAYVEDNQQIDLIDVLEHRISPDGRVFNLEVYEDYEMAGSLGFTRPDGSGIVLSRSTYEGAERSDGRSRFTVAHEFGHLAMHCREGYHRLAMPAESVPRYQDPEWQANTFAAGLLAPIERALVVDCAITISEQYGMSYEAANYYHTNFNKKRAELMRALK